VGESGVLQAAAAMSAWLLGPAAAAAACSINPSSAAVLAAKWDMCSMPSSSPGPWALATWFIAPGVPALLYGDVKRATDTLYEAYSLFNPMSAPQGPQQDNAVQQPLKAGT
jgi:hypothetical protein